MRSRPLIFGAAMALSTLPLAAQVLRPFRSDDDKPVMRAVPVDPPRAVPADPAEPPATPSPRTSPKATPRKAKAVRPDVGPAPMPIPSAPEPADPGDIRMAPQIGGRTAEQSQLAVADSYYGRKMYDVAAPEYQRYVEQYPGGDDVPAAMFRLAECFRRSGSLNSAKTAYDQLLSRYQAGEFVGPAAYRLADLYYQERNYTLALPLYRKAALRLKEIPVANAARFYTARCLEAASGAGNKLEAGEIYRELAESARETNPFADASRLSLALILREADRTAEALRQIQSLAKQTDNPELKAEASVRAGLWELDLQQPVKAADDLKKALEMPSLGRWKEIAQVGLLRVNYDSGKYKQVIDSYAEIGKQITSDLLPEVLILAANSHRQLSHFTDALTLYDRVVKDYPGSAYSKEAAYQRLVCLYNSESENLVAEIDSYLTNLPETQKRDHVMLMKAEALFKKDDYLGSGAIYATVVVSTQLPAPLKAEALYKLGWCCMQTRDYDHAVKAFTQFIDENPVSKQLCAARVQRGIAYQSQKNLAAAEKDYTEVIKKFPACKERELALQQAAIIRGQMSDKSGMAEDFVQLLHDYPKSPAVPQAHYWIGLTAYESKNFKLAAEHLKQARDLDQEHYFEKATLPLMLAYNFLEDRENVAREVDLYRTQGKQQVPADVIRWLGEQLFDSKSYESAEKYLLLLAERPDVLPRDLLKLGQSRLHLAKFAEAAQTLAAYLGTVKEPISRALGLLDLARAQIGMKDLESAQKTVDEILTLQPEGKLSGEARILAGDIDAARGNWEAAAKIHASIAVLLDDNEVTPRALEKAAEEYQKAGKEAEAKKVLNNLKSRYPEYMQGKKSK